MIFGFLLLLHGFIFRDVIVAIPDILRGDASIVREELVPFFRFDSQFWGDGTSALTSSEEVRVSYSFWTAWVRYDKVLPFAIVIMNTVSAFVLFYAFHRIGRYFYKKALFGVAAALAAALLIHAILLYAKMAHFYVLIIGFSLFALSLSLFLEQLFFKPDIGKKNIAAVSLLTLLNPAIHYHVIFYVVIILILIFHLLFTAIMNKTYLWKYTKRGIGYALWIVLFSLVPYVIYVYLTTASSLSGVSTQIPVNYWMIFYASLPLPFIFSLDTAGHLDLLRHGNYIAPIPRFGSMIVMFLIGGLLIFKRWKTLQMLNKVFIMTLFGVMLFAIWMTIGYSENSPYSFHKVFGDLAIFFAHMGNSVGSLLAELMKTFINILRFPHRFQFIYFYAAGVLLMIALVWLREVFMKKMKPSLASLCVIGIAMFPLVGNVDYRTALFSGNLATFVTPYEIPQDLKNIKSTLNDQSGNKLFILPTLESGREILQDGKRYSFLDKYLIYYLNEPTYYYGAGANTINKLSSYMIYRAIAYDEAWWEDILANNLGITDIVVPHHTEPRPKGITYLPGIDVKIMKSLSQSTKYQKIYDGQDYSLYSIRSKPKSATVTMVDMSWKNMLGHLNTRDERLNDQFYFPLQMTSFGVSDAPKRLLTDSPERSFYDFYANQFTGSVFIPNPISLPFSPEYVASSNFTNNALSLSTLYSKSDNYNYLHENVPSLTNFQRPSFVGLTKGKLGLDIAIDVPSDGEYRLLLHAGAKAKTITVDVSGSQHQFNKIESDRMQTGDYLDVTYFTTDVSLKKGKQVVTVKNAEQGGMVIDSLGLLSKQNIPSDFKRIQTDWLHVQPTDDDAVYNVAFRSGRR